MPDVIDTIKEVAVSSIFSDDTLRNIFVLKGGNALSMVYKVISRSSLDIDLSIQTTLDDYNIKEIKMKIEKALKDGFRAEDYTIFDYSFEERPRKVLPGVPYFWGGYLIKFKVIPIDQYNENDIIGDRQKALNISPDQSKIFSIDISKYEYCETKVKSDLQGYVIYTYSPEMIVFEKLRAICQQTDEYNKIFGKSHKGQRARDFYDIFCIINSITVNWQDKSNKQLIENIFAAKQVPLSLLLILGQYREMHKLGYDSLRDTVYRKDELNDFDFYFDYVILFIGKLKASGII